MTGEPDDVEGACNARLFLGDNYGDNHTTILCELHPYHDGRHTNEFSASTGGKVRVEWADDQRVPCTHCPAWRHEHAKDEVANACPFYDPRHDLKACVICLAARTEPIS